MSDTDTRFQIYNRRPKPAEMRPYEKGEDLGERVSISAADAENGSPRLGDMIARNPEDHSDQWLVAKEYFEKNFNTDPVG